MQHKKIFSIFVLSLAVSICMATTAQKELNVVASFYPTYIMAKNVVNDVPGVKLTMLAPPITGCLHDYAPTVKDMKKLAHADIFVANGAGMESFLDRIVSQYPAIKTIQTAQGIPLIKSAGDEGDNPHLWVSISCAISQVKNLGKAMEEIDPKHKEKYRQNTKDYVKKLNALQKEMARTLAPYKGKKIITFHEAFPYFAREFGFEIAAVIEREPGSEPSAKELADTIQIIRKNKIAVLFSEPQYPALAAKTVARETGSHVYVLDPAVTGPDSSDAYLKIMRENLKVLKDALAEKQ